jgi:hypothetical protein
MKTVLQNQKNNQKKAILNALKVFAFGLIIMMQSQKASAQFVVEPFVSEDNFILESWIYKSIDQNRKFSIFSLNEFNHNYDTNSTSFLSYGILGYDVKKGFGPAIGWRTTANRTSALGGLQYGLYGKNYLAYFILNTELRNNPNFEFYSLLQYRVQLSEKLRGFGQLQISKNFNEDNHVYSMYRLRLGLDLGKFQTGFGLEQNLQGADWNHKATPGVFFRMELY